MISDNGCFIVFEGIDGSGTTTLSKMLVDKFSDNAVWTNEPTGGEIGSLIRKIYTGQTDIEPIDDVMSLLFYADRADHLHRTILPNLQKGRIVVSDRYDLSTFIYQLVSHRNQFPNDPTDNYFKWLKSIGGRYRKPNIIVVLDTDIETSIRRRSHRINEKDIYEKRSFLIHTREMYRRFKIITELYDYENCFFFCNFNDTNIDELFDQILESLWKHPKFQQVAQQINLFS